MSTGTAVVLGVVALAVGGVVIYVVTQNRAAAARKPLGGGSGSFAAEASAVAFALAPAVGPIIQLFS